MEEKMPTTEKLVKAMREYGCGEDMVTKARNGYYDDFKSPLKTPCIQLISDLEKIGAHALKQRAMNGEFDAQKWESDEWAQSEEGQEAFRNLNIGADKLKEIFGVTLNKGK